MIFHDGTVVVSGGDLGGDEAAGGDCDNDDDDDDAGEDDNDGDHGLVPAIHGVRLAFTPPISGTSPECRLRSPAPIQNP